jgi:hypothetical protein
MMATRDLLVAACAALVIIYLGLIEVTKNERIKTILSWSYIIVFYASLAFLALAWFGHYQAGNSW